MPATPPDILLAKADAIRQSVESQYKDHASCIRDIIEILDLAKAAMEAGNCPSGLAIQEATSKLVALALRIGETSGRDHVLRYTGLVPRFRTR